MRWPQLVPSSTQTSLEDASFAAKRSPRRGKRTVWPHLTSWKATSLLYASPRLHGQTAPPPRSCRPMLFTNRASAPLNGTCSTLCKTNHFSPFPSGLQFLRLKTDAPHSTGPVKLLTSCPATEARPFQADKVIWCQLAAAEDQPAKPPLHRAGATFGERKREWTTHSHQHSTQRSPPLPRNPRPTDWSFPRVILQFLSCNAAPRNCEAVWGGGGEECHSSQLPGIVRQRWGKEKEQAATPAHITARSCNHQD